jgi:hypothetical protein
MDCVHLMYSQTFVYPSPWIRNDYCVRCGMTRKIYRGRSYARTSPLELFKRHTTFHENAVCIVWTGGLDNGAPRFYYRDKRGNRQSMYAHRWNFRDVHGYLPASLIRMCDTERCVSAICWIDPANYEPDEDEEDE